MKRMLLWGFSLMISGVVLWWGFQGVSQATHRSAGVGYSAADPRVGAPQDSVSDNTPDHPGSERAQRDRTPDRPTGTATAGDLTADVTPDRSANRDGVPDSTTTGPDRTAQRDAGKDNDPDCGNGPGDSNCGNSPFVNDNKADNFGAGESISDKTPDRPIAAGFNRMHDEVTDGVADNPVRDAYRMAHGLADTIGDRVGARDCIAVDVAVGECDDSFTDQLGAGGKTNTAGQAITERDRVAKAPGARDRVGPDTVPDGVADRVYNTTPSVLSDNEYRANQDGDRAGSNADGVPDRLLHAANSDNRPDSKQDRANHRDRGRYDHAIASRDAYSFGPGDRVKDHQADEGGLGYASVTGGGSGSSGGCSMVASRTATTGSSVAYLLVLLTPVAIVVIRRRLRRR